MIKFYYSGAPNPMKVALMLEETGLAYEAIPVDTRKGDQHKPDYLKINPNAKVPAIVDGDAVVFDSNAILLYLGEKTGKFMPANTPKLRGELLSICTRRSGTIKFWTSASASRNTWSATPTASSTWRCGAGRGSSRWRSASRPGANSRT
jgi:glutathione S-transferase